MNMKKTIILLSAIALLGNKMNAQDIHFSQWGQTPALVNPALTGSLAVVRASIIYKDARITANEPVSAGFTRAGV